MKIYETRIAPNPRRVRIFLAEKGLEIPFEEIDIMKLDCKTEEFTAKNPMQRVPVLELDDGTTISESVAVCRYFEETNPEPPLFGTNPVERAQVEMWNRRSDFNLLFPIASAFRHTHPAMAELEVPQVAEWGEANQSKIDAALALYDDELKSREFIAGDCYSIADITAICAIDFMRVLGRKLEDQTNLIRWREAMKARPSYTA